MSFDLYFFEGSVSEDSLPGILDQETDRTTYDAPLGPKLTQLLDLLRSAYPGDTDDELEESPWASWPLEGNGFANGLACAVNIRTSGHDEITQVISDACDRLGIVIYDPQGGELLHPYTPSEGSAAAAKPKELQSHGPWWKRLFRGRRERYGSVNIPVIPQREDHDR